MIPAGPRATPGGAPVNDMATNSHPVARWFHGFGVLRLMLVAAALLLIAIGPFSGGRVVLEGLAVITTLVAPVAYAVFVFVLPLDMMMTGIFMSDADAAKRARLRRVLITEGVLLAVLMLSWLPFVLMLVSRR